MTRVPREAIPPTPRGYRNGKPYHWTHTEADQQLGWMIDRLTQIRTELEQAWGRAVDWTPGISAGTGVSVSGGRYGDDGAINGRTPTLALRALTEASSGAACDFHIILENMVRASKNVSAMTGGICRLRVAEPADDVVQPVLPKGVGECGNPACGRFCDAKRSKDRRRGPLCPACDTYLREHSHLARDDAMRPHRLTARDDGHPRDTCRLCVRDELEAQGVTGDELVSMVDQRTR